MTGSVKGWDVSTRRIALLGVALMIVGALGSAPALAQCALGPRVFATIGGGMNPPLPKVRVHPGSSWNNDQQIGRFWQSDDSTLGNNWALDNGTIVDPNWLPLADGCPSDDSGDTGWWQVAQTSLRGIQGAVGIAVCEANTCPVGDMTFVIEDYGPLGPPGVNDTAFMIAFRVDQTSGQIRDWDLAKVGQNDQVLIYLEYPLPSIRATVATGTDRLVTMDIANMSFHSHVGHESTNPAPITDLDVISTYDLVLHTGTSDPGRDRFASGCAPPNPGGICWTTIHKVDFQGFGPEGVVVTVPCNSQLKDSYIALGASFVGGAGPDVPSSLVGRALQVECDPNLVTPHPGLRPGLRDLGRTRGDRFGSSRAR